MQFVREETTPQHRVTPWMILGENASGICSVVSQRQTVAVDYRHLLGLVVDRQVDADWFVYWEAMADGPERDQINGFVCCHCNRTVYIGNRNISSYTYLDIFLCYWQ